MRSWPDPTVRRAVLAVVKGVHGQRNGDQGHADTDRLNHDQAADLVMAEIRRLRMEDVTVLPTGLAPQEQAAVWATVRHAAVAELAALGRLQPLLDDDSVQDANINGCDEVWVIRSDGEKTRADPVADTDEQLLRLGQRIARRYGREGEQEWSETRPIADVTLTSGHRISLVRRLLVAVVVQGVPVTLALFRISEWPWPARLPGLTVVIPTCSCVLFLVLV